MVLGVIFSLFSGLGFAFMADAVSGTVRGVKGVKQVVGGIAPLAVIPYQLNMSDIKKRHTFKKRTIIVGALAILAAVLLIHFVVSPLDVLWFRILRKIDVLTA